VAEGRFQLVEVLGRGAYAAVVVARDRARKGEPLVALKVLRRDHLANATAINRFRDEARILATLDHHNIVRVHDLLDYDGQPVMVMEYVRGASLEELCLGRHKRIRLPGVVTMEVARRVALALHDAYHSAVGASDEPMRIIHRDVKPANIMLSDRGEVKLLDFGIAKGDFQDRRAKSLYNVAGSAGYDAPERRTGNDTPGADVFALGVTLFVCLTGKPMLLPAGLEVHETSADELVRRVDVPGVEAGAVQGLLRRMIAFRPAERPSMAAVAAELDAMLVGTGDERDLDAGPAARSVLSVLARRTAYPAAEATGYARLQFLEDRLPSPPPKALTSDEAASAVRAFLSLPNWEERVPELQRLLDAAPGFNDAPFVEIVRRAQVPWWRFWSSAARVTEVEAALMLLCDHATPTVLRHVGPLMEHPDQRIAAAARFLLEQQTE
jgi:serine/threonine protein kinase